MEASRGCQPQTRTAKMFAGLGQFEFFANTVIIPWEFMKFGGEGICFPAKIYLTLEDEDYLSLIK